MNYKTNKIYTRTEYISNDNIDEVRCKEGICVMHLFASKKIVLSMNVQYALL